MLKDHVLFFKPQIWLGQGKITFSMSDDVLPFYARWTVHEPEEEGEYVYIQEVEVEGMTDKMENRVRIYDFSDHKFCIEMENPLWGKAVGEGLIDHKVISWEFRRQSGFEGFEIYEVNDNGQYYLRAEYMSPDLYRTHIQGELWSS